ncbi:MAG: NAD-dependent epimerase/dehydratase family protein [Halioglobus sp.]|nr:NAD-dependent epimerase/dehydratase family protein [Halioglobus sp.]
MKCLVTGATGFIGRRLCQQLGADGHSVAALSRAGGALDNGLKSSAVDLTVVEPAISVLDNVDTVFHLAGVAHRRANSIDYETLNHRATLRLARQASRAGVGCFVFLSSVKAMGLPTSAAARAEHDIAQPTDHYGASKRRAELDLLREFTHAAMSVIILRPVLVYGPHVKGNLQQIVTGVRWGLPRPPGGGARSMVALDDLVELLVRIARNPPSGTHTWIVSGQAYSTRAIYDVLRAAMGKTQGVAWLPRWAWVAASSLLDALTGQPQRSTYLKLFGDELYDGGALQRASAWCPSVRLEHVINQLIGAIEK